MATIVILEHLMQKGLGQPYLVYTLAQHWQAQGHRVVVHHGVDAIPNGDLAIVNIDATVIPPAYREVFAQFPRVLNAAAWDISKRNYSALRVDRDSDWQGKVIIKTDRNFGGKIDRVLRRRAIDAGMTPDIDAGPIMREYAVLESIEQIRDEIWSTDGIIVEKFLPERDEHGYYMRVWVFLGDQNRSFRMLSPDPIIKSHNIIKREPIEVPDQMRAWRERLGFDYAKFDYVLNDDGPTLIDANRTPGAPAGAQSNPEIIAGLEKLASGLKYYLS